jgi:hypothetical protein
MDIAKSRLISQRLVGAAFADPTSVVRWCCAVQAQDYLGAKWALALRCPGFRSEAIDSVFNAGHFVRTHVMRPTWHFVAAEDLRWLLKLTGPRVQQVNGHMYRKLELDTPVLSRAAVTLRRALEGGRTLTRKELAVCLERAGVAAQGLRLAYILMHAELTGLVCSGPLRGKQHTYALLEERVVPGGVLGDEEALVTLLRRYLASHGPATVHDFAWWSGLKVSDARNGLEDLSPDLERIQIDGATFYWVPSQPFGFDSTEVTIHLLPNYDEHVVAYKDHQHSIDPAARAALRGRQDGPLDVHLVARDGRVIGGWRRKAGRSRATIETSLLVELLPAERAAMMLAAESYGRFIELPVEVIERGVSDA